MYPLSSKKLFLFDIDGTLALGDDLFPGSKPLLDYITSMGGRSYFITNNSTNSNADYVKRFRETFHLETREEDFVTSGSMALRFLAKHYPNDLVYVLGTSSFIRSLREAGLHITEEASPEVACVLVAYDSELTYAKLTQACKALTTTCAPFYATNPDLCCPISFETSSGPDRTSGFGFVPDCGSICQMLTNSCGKEPIYLGKPNKEVVELCLSDSGFTAQETLVVGDRLYTDIACGIQAGVDTCVLFTGEATPQEAAASPFQATYALEDVDALLKACYSLGNS